MEVVAEYGLFLAKTVTLLVAALLLIVAVAVIGGRGRRGRQGQLKVRHLNRKRRDMANLLKASILPRKVFRRELKAERKRLKSDQKLRGSDGHDHRRIVFVLDFRGDLRASAVASLREEITAILSVARPEDEVLLRLESAGGLVPAYGLAASQLTRIRQHPLTLTVAVDKVAASGGYMMACVADHIIAAPFAIVGSIGVVAQLPNFHRALQKHDVDYEMFTGGEYKRTVTVFGENTDQDRAKYQEEIDDTHALFKEFVQGNRSQVDIEKIATGEHWFGTRALELQLVDALRTSDDYLMEACEAADLYEVSYHQRKGISERLRQTADSALRGLGWGNFDQVIR